ncbi:MAG: HAD family hydrolase [Burkholderiales bacterium]|nr:HAD family hydrolase [Burkholderiales bacterium]
MNNLALFDLDHTLLPLDSDNEWGQFLVRIGVLDAAEFGQRNAEFYAQYQAGTLNPDEYLEFALGTLAKFKRKQLDAWRAQFMAEVIQPAILPAALELLDKHRSAGDLLAIVTATNRYVTEPIAQALGVEHLIAAEPAEDAAGEITGRLLGQHNQGAGKVHNTRAWLAKMNKDLSSFEQSHFYSDSHNDIPLMSVVTHPVATNPNAKLKAHASAQGWPLLTLFND